MNIVIKYVTSVISDCFVEKEEKYAPEFIKTPAEVIARENDRSQFLVKVIGMPSPTGK